jgi:hypothetical protein
MVKPQRKRNQDLFQVLDTATRTGQKELPADGADFADKGVFLRDQSCFSAAARVW